MAFVLTPRFAPAYQAPQCNPFGFCAPVSRPTSGYRVSRPQPRRPQYSYNQLFSQVDELLSEIDREAQRQAQLQAHLEAQREAHRQRQAQRKRALRANFKVDQNEQGWQIDGDIQGFAQENMTIEALDEHTLKIAGNTKWEADKAQSDIEQPQTEPAPAIEQPIEETHNETGGVTLNEPEVDEPATETEITSAGATTPDSDTSSHRSYQATVEDDFEDLGADISSSRPSTPAEPTEAKGKEKAVEQSTTAETAVTKQPQPEAPVVAQQQEQPQHQERVHGSFERTFRFPERIDVANVSASFKDGLLRITVPRAQIPQTKRIAIL